MLRQIQESHFDAPPLSPTHPELRPRWHCRRFPGTGVDRPLCEGEFRCWVGREGSDVCRWCESFGRHRLLWLYLRRQTEELGDWSNLLYFAPDPYLDWLRRRSRINCVTTNLCGRGVDVHADITRLPFATGTFDAVICSHVLEHVPDDARAMRELFRVLKRGGEALIQVPLNRANRFTDESPDETDPLERERRFGQFDHVRRYGSDIVDRLIAAGFVAQLVSPMREVDQATARRYGLFDDGICSCRKPVADIQ